MHYGFKFQQEWNKKCLEVFSVYAAAVSKCYFLIIFIEETPKSAPQICDMECFKLFIMLHLSPKLTSVLFAFCLFSIP